MTISNKQSQPFLIPPNTIESNFDSIKKVYVNVKNSYSRNEFLINMRALSDYFILDGKQKLDSKFSVEIIDFDKLQDENFQIDNSFNVIFLGDDWSDKEMIKAFILGCKGFITKSSSHVLLREIIGSTIHYKGNYLLHQISERFKASELLNLTIKDFNQVIQKKEFDDCPLNSREISILEQIAKGTSSKSIAEILNLGEQTIKNYVSGILIKIGAQNRTHAVYISIKNNWITTLN
ncbi:MAG: hypothetical protein CL780_00130 [Chloroflexi bacterium]|nr:hypothetical protein [Chloroflexota bacterium]